MSNNDRLLAGDDDEIDDILHKLYDILIVSCPCQSKYGC